MGVLTDARTQHRYQTCRDEECQRFACRVYREGSIVKRFKAATKETVARWIVSVLSS